jgi:hypothetical protein
MTSEKADKTEALATGPTEDVVVEGRPVERAARPAKTPRDVAIHKTKAGEDVGLEESKADRTPAVVLPHYVSGESFVDVNGVEWTKGKQNPAKAAVIDPTEVRKQGGDPGLLGIGPGPAREQYIVDRPGNRTYSPNPEIDSETGEIISENASEPDAPPVEAPVATVAEHAVTAGRGGSGAKARANAAPRGKSKKITRKK